MNQKYLNAISLEKTKRRKGIEGRQTGACEGRKGQNTWKLCLKKKKKKKGRKGISWNVVSVIMNLNITNSWDKNALNVNYKIYYKLSERKKKRLIWLLLNLWHRITAVKRWKVLVTLLAFFPIKKAFLVRWNILETELGLDSHSPESITIFPHTRLLLFLSVSISCSSLTNL